MIKSVIDKIFGTKSERDLKKIQHYVDKANQFTAEFEKLSEEQSKSGIFDKVKKAMGME